MKKAWKGSAFSLTKPSMAQANPRALASKTRTKRSVENAKRRVGKRYMVATDVSEFYPSLYTHTIPWAIHGKSVGKLQRHNKQLLGNQLDIEVRNGQDEQTKGIPIGPDTSLAIAEIVMASIDKQIHETFPDLTGVRYIDDMYFFTESQAQAEELLMTLEARLGEFELQLNQRKTRILTLPQTLDHGFLGELRARIPEPKTKKLLAWTDYFDGAFSLAIQHPYDNVLRYAVSQVSHIAASRRTWETVQHLLWQTVALDPGTIRFVLPALLRNRSQKLSADVSIAQCALDHLIATSAPYGHSSEVAWALWAFLVLGSAPSEDAWKAVLAMSDDVVAVSAHAARVIGNWDLEADDLWNTWLQPGGFFDEHWLFVYEACRNLWCKKQTRAAIFKGESGSVAKFLFDRGFTFVDMNAPANFRKAKAQQSFGY